ncbi:asparagine synthetase B [Micromonospora fiedleri]|uniref:asparagine synthase (glutamine-hydrolyzing) n=1 Tax=Micromonospora fiedleri TaxID=1157498 RepID=A0ABS1UP34_9ACTN|nr:MULTISPECIES: asparagine synthase-related protein [Micromonospora]MBL6278107.1 asparagine synthetase B [Micromonospora fiedleri]WSK41211.1 asparagine synthase-related protein [Micromonospora maris]
MCGIVLSLGPEADPVIFRRMLAVLAPRGEVTETRYEAGLLAGTRRLRVVDRDRAVQPWVSADERWLLCYNGEVFNHHQLRAQLTGLGHRFRSASDTEVVLAAFAQWGEQMVTRLRGEYAFAIVERATGRAYLVRDPLGVKPLYLSRTPGCLHLASEVKALVRAGAPVVEVPPGHHGWIDADHQVHLRPYVDLLSLGADAPMVTDPDEAALLVRTTLTDSIQVRLDTDLTVGVVLSGGLDSSLVLLHAAQRHPDCVAVTVGVPDSPDVAYARRLAGELGVRHEVVELRPRDIRLADVREAIRISELTEYGDIINAVVSVPIFRRLAELGVKVVLTGDGSDELFGGYPMYHEVGPEVARRLFLHKIRNLCRTELQRVDRTSMGFGVEARVPFLDLALVELAMRLPIELKMREGQEKWIVRRAFADLLPDYIRRRPKNPMSYSSGLHERARLYKPLFARLHRTFGYHLLEPVRRDFDSVLMSCDNDLDAAIAAGRARRDYTVLEHARDLVGAARWNAAPMVRRLVTPRRNRGDGAPLPG